MDKDQNKVTATNEPGEARESSQAKDKAKSGGSKKVILIAAGILVLLLLAAGTYVLAFYNQVQEPQRMLLEEVIFEEEYAIGEVFPGHIVNIGLMGFDRGWNRENMGESLFRPDMLAVLSINFDTDQISIVRIPRDSYVPIHGMGGIHDKINHSFFYGYQYGKGDDSEVQSCPRPSTWPKTRFRKPRPPITLPRS